MGELRSDLDRHQPKRIDAGAEKRAGWRQHCVLMVAGPHPRLSWPDRELANQLGRKLYGRRKEALNG